MSMKLGGLFSLLDKRRNDPVILTQPDSSSASSVEDEE